MECFSLLFIVVLISGFCQDTDGTKPRMSPDKDTLFINSRKELKIECYSKGARLQFSFPESTLLVPRSEHKIRESRNGTYTFLRSRAHYTDTGWYACAEEGIKIDNDFRNIIHTDEHVSWIYVYVNVPDLFDVGFAEPSVRGRYPKTIVSVPGSDVVIPCRPTRPRKVELWQNFRVVDSENEAVRFDPKIGFMMKPVAFSNDGEIVQCKLRNMIDQYILRFSGPKPTMITPNGEDLILQKGDVLRIECFSESELTFLYPTILTNSSGYEIVKNENGTSTFLRHSVISDDTGWYGCAGVGIENHDIPEYSINYTKKEINWVYAYVNSSVKIISPPMDSFIHTPFNGPTEFVIPCRPTTPDSHIQLEEWDGQIWNPELYSPFDPRVGYFVSPIENGHSVYRCAMTEPVRYVSKNYSYAEIKDVITQISRPAVLVVDDPSNSDGFIIQMTGDDLRMRCEMWDSTTSIYRLEWAVPNTVSANRIKYNRTSSDSRIFRDVLYLRKKTLEITVTNLTETEAGEYICSVTPDYDAETDSRTVEVFDEAGGRYVMPDGKKYPNITLIGRKGETIKWLLNLRHCPYAKIPREMWHNTDRIAIKSQFEMKIATRCGTRLILFIMRNLTATSRGRHEIYFWCLHLPSTVTFDVDVQEPPTVRLDSTKELLQTGEARIVARCWSFGSPEPNITIALKECLKYPSLSNCTRRYDLELYDGLRENEGKIYHRQLNISMSGILTCQACNILGCSVATKYILFSASDEPYFTSTNLHETEVVLDMVTRRSSEPLILECYAAGNPYPNVTWFKDDVKLEDSKQHKFAYDNRELSVLFYFGDEGGRYSCRAQNVHGSVENSIDIILQENVPNIIGTGVSETVFISSVIAVVVTLLIVIVICCIVIYRLYMKASRKKLADLAFEKGGLKRFNPELSVVDQAELLPYDLKWEYPRGLLKFDKTLGSGAFGIVKKAEAKSICRGEAITTVAVKLVRSTASLNFMTALTRELKILAYLGKHPNVVNLLGACTKNVFYGELYVIVEYCRFGNLRDHLLNGRDDFDDEIYVDASRLSLDCANTNGSGVNSSVDGGKGSLATVHRDADTDVKGNSEASDDESDREHDSDDVQCFRSKYKGDYTDLDLEPICTRDLVYWSWQVSRGMEFLGQRRIVHGDLAARNILLADNGIVKICDFGLAKALYKEAEYRDTGANPLPVKWMAIESIKDQVFSVESDVWSFGIVMWEIFSLGETPYPGMRHMGLVQKLVDGYRMGRPKYAATTMYDMMRHCWDADPAKRPSFNDLSHNLCELLDDGFKTQYLEMHAQYMEINAEAVNDGKDDYLTMSPSAIAAASSSKVKERIKSHNLPQDVSETPV